MLSAMTTDGLDDTDPAFARVRDSFASQSMMATLGAELLDLAPGRCRIAAPILALARQQQGYGHAALTFALGDTAAGYAALSLHARGDDGTITRVLLGLCGFCALMLLLSSIFARPRRPR